MSRIAKKPLQIPSDVEFKLNNKVVSIKGKKGQFNYQLPQDINLEISTDNVVTIAKFNESNKKVKALAGTTRAILGNMVEGVSVGFVKKLTLVGVGYRAKASGKKLELSLGYSHPVSYDAPEGITIETPSNTEIVISGADKREVGQVAAEIRSLRSPDSYKGKGVRYSDEQIILKETKKK